MADGSGAQVKQAWSWKTGSPEKRDRMEAYLDWLLTPKEARKPKTKTKLAERLGVTLHTLRNYTKDPWLQRELIQRGRALNRVERAPDVLEALYRQAVDGDNPRSVSAAKVWLDFVNRHTEEALPDNLTDLSDDDLVLLAQRIIEQRSSEG